MTEALDQFIKQATCCCCERAIVGPLNIVQLNAIAKWKYPVMVSLPGGQPRACALICEPCRIIHAEIRFAIEFSDGALTLHPLNDLIQLEE